MRRFHSAAGLLSQVGGPANGSGASQAVVLHQPCDTAALGQAGVAMMLDPPHLVAARAGLLELSVHSLGRDVRAELAAVRTLTHRQRYFQMILAFVNKAARDFSVPSVCRFFQMRRVALAWRR